MDRMATRKYQTQQIMSASPAKLVAMLYDKAVNCLQDALRAIEAGEVEARWRANARAIEIIEHLWLTLDLDQGGEIAANLDKLYSFILAKLPEVDLHNDPQPARDAIGLLEPLRKSWHTVLDPAQKTPAPAPAAGTPAGTPAAAPSAGPGADAAGKKPAGSEPFPSPGIALSA